MDAINYSPDDLTDHHAIGAVITNQKGEILMQKHVKYGFWTIPVGKVKQGQGVEEGLKQELFEECDIVLEKWKEIAQKECFYIRNGKKVAVLLHVFSVLNYSGIIKNKEPDKHTTQVFMSREEIEKLPSLSDATQLYLQEVKNSP